MPKGAAVTSAAEQDDETRKRHVAIVLATVMGELL
jgi:hypothetical protein